MLRTVRPPSVDDHVIPGDEDAAVQADEPEEDVHEAGIPDIPDRLEEAPEPPPVPPANPEPRPRPKLRQRITVDEHASHENAGVLIKKAQIPVPMTDVNVPSPSEVAKHNLTHLPYKRWRRFCVAARCLNIPHVRLPPFSRKHPLLVLD